jgi:hypothetical protein
MYNHGIKHDMLNKHFSQKNIQKVNDMNADKIPDELLELKKQLIFEKNNRLNSFERETQKIRRLRVLDKNINLDELNVHCIYCKKNVAYNNTRQHNKQITHRKNMTMHYNNKLKIDDSIKENVLHIDG